MNAILERHLPEIQALSRQCGVQSLEAFGSVVGNTFDEELSDVDLLVEFQPRPGANLFNAYCDLLQGLRTILGRPVDLIMPSAVRNPYVKNVIETERVVVYAA